MIVASLKLLRVHAPKGARDGVRQHRHRLLFELRNVIVRSDVLIGFVVSGCWDRGAFSKRFVGMFQFGAVTCFMLAIGCQVVLGFVLVLRLTRRALHDLQQVLEECRFTRMQLSCKQGRMEMQR